MDSKLLVGLIKEVVKNEVNRQVKEEISKLVKSGTINFNKKESNQPLVKLTESKSTAPISKRTISTTQQKNKEIKEYSKNPILNEVLNMTTPFSKEQRIEGGMMGMAGGSILDMLQRGDEEWGEISMTTKNMNNVPTPTSVSENGDVNVVMKALNRDYTELVKRFK